MPAVAAAAVYVWEIDGRVSSATTAAQALSDDNFYPFFCFVVCTHLSLLSFISSANQTDCTQLSRTRKLWRRWGGPGRAAIYQWCKTIAATMERDTSIALFLLSLSYICSLGCYIAACLFPSWAWTRHGGLLWDVHTYTYYISVYRFLTYAAPAACVSVCVCMGAELDRRKWWYLFGDGGACAQFQGYPTPGAKETRCHGSGTSRDPTSPSVHLLRRSTSHLRRHPYRHSSGE